jgi:hypothetical protein
LTLPEKMNNQDTRTQLENLKTQSRKLADLVKAGAPDEQIGDALSALHENFHSIMEKWHNGKEVEHKEEH